MMKHAYLLFAFLFLSGLVAQAQQRQPATLQGRVLTVTGQPIERATLLVKGTSIGTSSDSTGAFSLTLPAGRYVLQVSMVGMMTLEKSGTAKAGAVGNLGTLRLTGTDKRLDEVVVVGKNAAQQIRESGFAVSAIDTKKLANLTTDLNQVLNRSTGVRVRENGGLGSDFSFSLNGLSGRAVKFFIDGVPIETFGSSLSFNNIPVNLAERIEVYKGVVPASLGSDALGGAVNVITNQRTRRYLDASYSLGSFNTHRAALSGAYTDSSGFTVRANGYFNYSDNNYLMRSNPEYGVNIEVVENNQFVNRDSRRFHDAYRSAMGQLETGFVNRRWADALLVGLLHSGQYKELQTGINVSDVLGGVTTTSDYWMPTLKYRKADFLAKGLSIDVFANYGREKILTADTSSFSQYDWDGRPRRIDAEGELGSSKSLADFTNTSSLIRANMSYALRPGHLLNLNYNVSQLRRRSVNRLRPQDGESDDQIRKGILGMSYQASLFNDRLTTSVFGKYYGITVIVNPAAEEKREDRYQYYGYGIANTLKLTESLGLKASYEHAYRLPDPVELLGDGALQLANPLLRPESSHNLNAGTYLTRRWGKHRLAAEASGFYRFANDFIFYTAFGRRSIYQNLGAVQITGGEADIRYDYGTTFSAGANVSYQRSTDQQEFVDASRLVRNVTYRNQLPNQPRLFGNADVSIGKSDVGRKGTRLQVGWFTQYVQWYYLTWEAYGNSQSKPLIPNQLLHDATLYYSLQNGRYNFSLEGRNLTNTLAYDNFRLQKPGRSVFVKFRYFFY